MTHPPGALFEQLLAIMARLRSPDGCPWDREQTRASLKPFLIEEAYEVLEAIDGCDAGALAEELGDLLFQVVFHAQLGAEERAFDMADVLRRVCEKMTSRHPHVFGGTRVADAHMALAQWEAIKQREGTAGGRKRSVLDGVPRALPGLTRAQRVEQGCPRGVRLADPVAVGEGRGGDGESQAALASGDAAHVGEELGDLLFSVVNVARLSSIDSEAALQGAIDKFRRRFTEMETALVLQGRSVTAADQDELERSWEATKAREREG
jgi:MazG family protein